MRDGEQAQRRLEDAARLDRSSADALFLLAIAVLGDIDHVLPGDT